MTPARILIVEDEAVIAEELSDRIAHMGHVVAGITASGDDGMMLAGTLSPDLVLMDIRLKGKTDGIAAAIAIRQQHDVPVIFLTAHSDAGSVERAKEAAPLGYLIKPFKAEDVRVSIQMALARHAADREQRQLLETQRLDILGKLARGIAHELGNLLVPITGNARLAAVHAEPESKLAKHLGSIIRASDRAADLCGQLRAYAGGGRFEISRCDVNAVIREIEQLLRVAVGRRATLTFDLVETVPPTDVDRSQIQQLLLNLTLNALDAVREGGTITVRTRQVNERPTGIQDERSAHAYAVIEVEDDGAGMDESTEARIFEPFFTTKPSARGLGLAAASGIARAHLGAIVVTSVPGRGSTFRVYLPLLSESV